MRRTNRTLVAFSHRPRVNRRREPRWIHCKRAGYKEHVDAGLREFRLIAFEISRVTREIFFRSELQRIHEHRCPDCYRLSACATYEREMTFMKRSHRRHEAEGTW